MAPKRIRGARKSGVTASTSRTARKAARQPSTDPESNDENSTIIKSSSGSNPRTEADAKPGRDREEVDVEASLLQPLAESNQSTRAANQSPTAVKPTRADKDAGAKGTPPLGAAKAALAGGKGKTGYRGRRMTSYETDDDDVASSPKVSTRSRSGHASSYQWETEILAISPEDIGTKLSYHNSINTTIEREGKTEKVRFRRGDRIWILPDPETLPPQTRDVDIEDLEDEYWWVGEILDCCALDQESQETRENLGLLRVTWYYTPDQALDLPNIHPDYKQRIRKYRFDDNERLRSDHVDFVGIECFGGFADGIESYLSIHGLSVDDKRRLKNPDKPPKSSRKNGVAVDGFKVKEYTKRAHIPRSPSKRKRAEANAEEE